MLTPDGVRAYEKAGFKEFGRRRQSHRSGGQLHDEIFMQCLSDEFESPVLGRIFAPDGLG
jgi:diamine N-acetyltransferase